MELLNLFLKKHKLFLYGGIIFFISLFLIIGKPISVKADGICGMYCNSHNAMINNNCSWEWVYMLGSDTYTCSVNTAATVSDPNTMPADSCIDTTNYMVCVAGTSCPSDFNDAAANGKSCEIRSASWDGWVGCNSILHVPNGPGKWDSSESQCITCNASNEESWIYDINASVFTVSAGALSFDTACSTTVAAACDDRSAGCIGTAGYCNSTGGWVACTAPNTCSGGACVAPPACGTNPEVTASPTSQSASAGDTKTYTITIKNNDQASCGNRTFNLTASGPSGWTTISLDKASVSLAPNGSDTATLTVKSSGTASNGSYNISVIAKDSADSSKSTGIAVDYIIGVVTCPANYLIDFTASKITNETNYKVNMKVNGAETGELCIYRYPISGTATDMGISPSTFGTPLGDPGCGLYSTMGGNYRCDNYDTGKKTGSYGFGTYRATLNPNSTSCNYNSPCFDTVQVVDCIVNGDCTGMGETCVGNTCIAATGTPPPTTTPGPGNFRSYKDAGTWRALNCASPIGSECSTLAGCTPAPPNPACYLATDCDDASGGNITNCCNNIPSCATEQLACNCSGATGTPTGTATGTGAPSSTCNASDGCKLGCLPQDPDCASAGCTVTSSGVTICKPTLTNSFDMLVQNVTGWILGIIGSLALLFLIIGGIMYIGAGGDQDRIKTAKTIVTAVVIGLIVVIASYSIINEIKKILGY